MSLRNFLLNQTRTGLNYKRPRDYDGQIESYSDKRYKRTGIIQARVSKYTSDQVKDLCKKLNITTAEYLRGLIEADFLKRDEIKIDPPEDF